MEEETPDKPDVERLAGDPILDPCDDAIENSVLLQWIADLKAVWTAPLPDKNISAEAARRFGVLEEYEKNTLLPVGTNSLELKHMRIEFILTRIQTQLEKRGLLDSSVQLNHNVIDPGTDIQTDISKIRECAVRLFKVLETELLARKACDPTWGSEMPTQRSPFGISMFESAKLTDQQQFIVYLLKLLALKGQQRYRDKCQKEILSPVLEDGRRYRTHAWREEMDIKSFVQSSAPKETSFEMWKNMTAGPNLEKATSQLETCCEAEFRDLKPDRHWFAFQNGLQCTNNVTFQPYGHPDVPPEIVAVNYHDTYFDPELMNQENWQDIPTPKLQKVIEDQMRKLTADEKHRVIQIVYMLLGRFLFEVNEKDSWQVIPFFYGRAGTGKSLVLDTLADLFRKDDIETVANNAQKGFGLETVQDKLGWRVMEVKRDFGIDQAQFQSMITGEEVSIQRKNKVALSVVWTAPGILAGNEFANWTDNSGSISRRLLIVHFALRVQDSDPNMKLALRNERAAFLHKITVAYLNAVDAMGKSDLWGSYKDDAGNKIACLPNQFHLQRKRVGQDTHAIASFLASADIHIQPDDSKALGMPFNVFKDRCNRYIQDNQFPRIQWTADKYQTIFEDHEIELVKLTNQYIRNHYNGRAEQLGKEQNVGTDWLCGCTLAEVHRANLGQVDPEATLDKKIEVAQI